MSGASRLASLLRSNRDRRCILFVGAGFSLGATRKVDGVVTSPPSGRALAQMMATSLGEDTTDLGELADLYIDKFGEHGLFELLTRQMSVTNVTAEQLVITDFRWRGIYTTNYDNVIEQCLLTNGIRYTKFNSGDNPSDIDYRTVPVVHVNGTIDGTSFNNFRSTVKLSSVHYLSDDFSRSKWGERFRSDIITAPCIVFAGYSLFDLDVARVLRSFEGMKERVFFVVQKNPSKSLLLKLADFGTILNIETDGLSRMLSEFPADELRDPTPPFSAWQRIAVADGNKDRIIDLESV